MKQVSHSSMGVLMAAFIAWMSASFPGWAGYTANLASSNVLEDFRFSMIGGFGTATGTHNNVIYTNSALHFEGRYAQVPSRGLLVGDSGDGSNYGRFSNDVSVSMTFTYYNGTSTNAIAALGMGMRTNAGNNTYPAYRAMIFSNQVLLQKQWEFSNATTNLAVTDLATVLGDTNVYRFVLASAVTDTNAFGHVLDLSLDLYENDGLVTSLAYTDIPYSSSASGRTYSVGHVALAGGAGPANNGTFRGIEVSAFSVTSGSTPSGGDTDDDGMPDAWETEHFGCSTCGTNSADDDLDGASNLDEYQYDTDPNDDTSVFTNRVASTTGTGILQLVVPPPTSTGRVYDVYATDNLQAEPVVWSAVGLNRPGEGSGSPVLLTVTNDAAGRFYRTGVLVP